MVANMKKGRGLWVGLLVVQLGDGIEDKHLKVTQKGILKTRLASITNINYEDTIQETQLWHTSLSVWKLYRQGWV